jgi:hypothetical protein
MRSVCFYRHIVCLFLTWAREIERTLRNWNKNILTILFWISTTYFPSIKFLSSLLYTWKVYVILSQLIVQVSAHQWVRQVKEAEVIGQGASNIQEDALITLLVHIQRRGCCLPYEYRSWQEINWHYFRTRVGLSVLIHESVSWVGLEVAQYSKNSYKHFETCNKSPLMHVMRCLIKGTNLPIKLL